MATPLYADVHVPGPVIVQLRRRGVDIVTANELGHHRAPDDELLVTSTSMGRVLVTQDIRFGVMAGDWQRSGRFFAGLIFAHQKRVSYGDLVEDLELIAKASDISYWQNRIEELPL